ncbi:MAG: M6 family metalloprotease domain-containing protein [Candidatus Cloacimonetes bacterium]|nr:M6 family metalloprotease domain-containing protein [Candidatus Cloacimonadota bacterium]
MRRTIIALTLFLLSLNLGAAYIENLDTVIRQPDGREIHCYASGDEFYNWLHDEQGFTIIQSWEDGYYYYAEQEGDFLRPSLCQVGETDPALYGLTPHSRISPALINAKAEAYWEAMGTEIRCSTRGLLNNIVVYIRFADQEEFPDPRSFYEQKFNDTTPGEVSLRSYYDEVSYGELELISYHYPVCEPEVNFSYQDPHPRSYFLPYHPSQNPEGYQPWERTEREHQLLADAVNAVSAQIPEDLDIDYNDDGYVDNVCFIIRGVHSAWADLLWAHRWALYSNNVYINGLRVWDYTFQPENQNTVRILAHEMFHALGAPDLYHYNFDGIAPAGPWDIMHNGFVHMGAHMKYKYGGWIEAIPEITASGFYTLQPLTSDTENCFRINSPYSTSEYFMVEYRKQDLDSYERYLPGSGLLVYRIVEDLNGNAGGPPDEVYIYRQHGTIMDNGSIITANFCYEEDRREINDYTDPSCFLSQGQAGGLNIHSIQTADETITFYVDFAEEAIPPLLTITSPESGAVLAPGLELITFDVSSEFGVLEYIALYIDYVMMMESTWPFYDYEWIIGEEDLGVHDIRLIAYNSLGLGASNSREVRVIDPAAENWFAWFTEDPVYDGYGRGCIQIMAAVDFNLGDRDYYVKKVALNIEPDPYGQPETPGLIGCQIVEFNQGITDNVLLDIGEFISPLTGRYEYDVYSQLPVSGRIAVVMDLHSYQLILFDITGTSGHSWLTETDRPWVDAVASGIIGAADISLLLSTDPTFSDELYLPPAPGLSLSNYPNPFNPETTISFQLPAECQKAELTIYNIKGQKLRSFPLNPSTSELMNSITWNGLDIQGNKMSSGVYFYRLQAGTQNYSRKMVLLK